MSFPASTYWFDHDRGSIAPFVTLVGNARMSIVGSRRNFLIESITREPPRKFHCFLPNFPRIVASNLTWIRYRINRVKRGVIYCKCNGSTLSVEVCGGMYSGNRCLTRRIRPTIFTYYVEVCYLKYYNIKYLSRFEHLFQIPIPLSQNVIIYAIESLVRKRMS